MHPNNKSNSNEEVRIKILRAGAIGGIQAPYLNITVDETISDEIALKEIREIFNQQGKLLSDALFDSLPGGTIDALLCEMMKRRASLFCVQTDA